MDRSALRAAVAAAPLGLLLVLSPRTGLAYELQIAPSGAPVRWYEDELVFSLEFDDRAAGLEPGDAEEAAANALATWSSAGGPHLVAVARDGQHGQQDEQDPDGPVIRFASDREEPDVQADSLARTRLSFDPESGRAQRVTITVNAFDYRWSVGAPCEGAYDLEATLAHEVGHALGFRHSGDPQATMFTQPSPCERDRRDLAADDLAAVAALYGEPASAAIDAAPPGGCAAGGGTGSAASAALLLILFGLLPRLTRAASLAIDRRATHSRAQSA